ncbi:hypothetical protein CF328_g7127 [Tilletia controversa]|nr:hypothetical protein CF328_g7127 [Tilletia controversa]
MDKVPGDDTSIQTDLEQERQRSGNPSTLGSSRVEAGSSSQSSAHPHPSGASTTSHGRGAPPHASHHAPPLPRLASQPLEGIAAGFTKYSSQTDTSKRLLENLGTDIPLAKERMDDEQLNYEQFSRATDNQIDILKDLAKAEVDPIKEQLLQEEADIWELAYLRCAKDDRTKRRWPMMAKYVALMRHNWYTTPAGERRFDPSKWQDPIWEHVMILKESGAFTEQPSTVMQHQASFSSHAHLSTSHTQQASSSKQKQPPRQQQQPFPASSSAETRSYQGASVCIMCGKGASPGHNFISCRATPPGRSTCFAYRNDLGHLFRAFDQASLCIANLLLQLRPDLAGKGQPLSSEGFAPALKQYGLLDAFQTTVDGPRDGFDFGVPRINKTITPPNHASARDNRQALNNIAAKEVEKGRWAGPYSKNEVERIVGPFQSSPLGIIPKPNGKVRLIQDFSHPKKEKAKCSLAYNSIKAYIESDEFLTGWDSVSDVFKLFNSLPTTVEGATMDASEAFRGCLARLSQLPGLVVSGVLVGDATKAIFEARLADRIKVLKWVDDFFTIRLDPTIAINDILAVNRELDFTWNPENTVDFRADPKYIGWVFNIPERKAVLPREKAEKYVDRASPFEKGLQQDKHTTQKLLGSLQHVAFVARDLRLHLGSIASFLASCPEEKQYQKRFIPVEVQKEAGFWVKALSTVPFVRSFALSPNRFPDTVWVDASTEWGIGVLVGEAWGAWKWLPGWETDGRGIGWAEAIALEFGLLAAKACGASNSTIDFRSDNQGVLYSYKRGHSRGKQINTVLKRVVDLERDDRIQLDIKYIESEPNPGDGPSIFPSGPRLPTFKIPPLVSAYVVPAGDL